MKKKQSHHQQPKKTPVSTYSLTPITQELVHQLKETGFRLTDQTYLVAVQHILEDTFDMFKAFCALGLPPQNIVALGKEYSTIPWVAAEMKKLGITVVDSGRSDVAEYYSLHSQNISLLWETVSQVVSKKKNAELLIISDGGEVITNIPKSILKNCVVVGEEQTTSGLFHFEQNILPIDVISDASSATKLYLESPLFTQAVVNRVTEYVKLPSEAICGVVGLGAIGSALCQELTRRGYCVYGFDKAVTTFLKDISYRPSHSLSSLMETCDYIFGCTGRDTFFEETIPFTHQEKLVLASASSGDKEFLSLLRYLKKHRDQITISQKNRTIHWETAFGEVTILRAGHPINFDNLQGSAPLEITQSITATLLAGGIQALLHLRRCGMPKKGNVFSLSPYIQRWISRRWKQYLLNHSPGYMALYEEGVFDNCGDIDWLALNSRGLVDEDPFLRSVMFE